MRLKLKKFQKSPTPDELQTFVGNKRNKLWIWTAVNHKQAGILAWVVGDRSAETFKFLWFIPHSAL
ncbi:IS1 family transposase [Trichocoleus sp. FACHB-90]|uniref:IS1 family transposase n=1 Tax=Funiculus sociatus TaxID=450527 RepID=UPI0016852418|nr:IS1 family transposase [Trichocoleus sp. FACHB-90]